jgi:hypothetical protein
MHAESTLLECLALLDEEQHITCALPAEVEYRHVVSSTAGPVDLVKVRCLRRHWFLAPIDTMTARPNAP